ncbi:MAG: hypothetical protein U1C55_06940 [Smithellaceae bacterium]|nr:hypothetical protein [Smithellaceae bacterium]
MTIAAIMLKRIGGFLTGEKIDGRRSNFYVEKAFQKNFILFFLVMVSLLILASGGAYYIVLQKILEENMYTIHPKFTSLREVLTPGLLLFFVEISVIAFIIIIIAVDRILNRIAKSLRTYERITEQLTKLDLKKARAIETKLFPDLHKEYLELIDKYSLDISLLREKVVRMNLLLKLLEDTNGMPKEKKILAMTELIELKGAVESKLMECQIGDSAKKTGFSTL